MRMILHIQDDDDDYVIGDDDEVGDRVINNHQCEVWMPYKVKVALQDLWFCKYKN